MEENEIPSDSNGEKEDGNPTSQKKEGTTVLESIKIVITSVLNMGSNRREKEEELKRQKEAEQEEEREKEEASNKEDEANNLLVLPLSDDVDINRLRISRRSSLSLSLPGTEGGGGNSYLSPRSPTSPLLSPSSGFCVPQSPNTPTSPTGAHGIHRQNLRRERGGQRKSSDLMKLHGASGLEDIVKKIEEEKATLVLEKEEVEEEKVGEVPCSNNNPLEVKEKKEEIGKELAEKGDEKELKKEEEKKVEKEEERKDDDIIDKPLEPKNEKEEEKEEEEEEVKEEKNDGDGDGGYKYKDDTLGKYDDDFKDSDDTSDDDES